MSCDVNTRIKEDIYDELMETPLGDFIDMIANLPSDVKIKNFTTEYEQIITKIVEKKFEENNKTINTDVIKTKLNKISNLLKSIKK